jgi:signal transduction histidine kinase
MGCGLGLYISRNLAKALGGNLDVHSIMGKGTTFVFTIKNNDTNLKNFE